jgi:outer membrane murein-binding lipoprotein Lpp
MQRLVASLLFVGTIVVRGVPAAAQGPGNSPPNYQQLAAAVSTLTARVSALESQVQKLQGKNITAADLAGTYQILGFETEKEAGPGAATRNSAYVPSGTAVLNVDGTGTFTSGEDGSTLRTGCIGCPLVEAFTNHQSGPFTWTFDPATQTLQLPGLNALRVITGGPGIAFAFSGSNIGTGFGHEIVQIFIRQPNP